VLKVSPISGVIAPYGTAQLQVTFKPLAPQLDKGFAGQPLTPQQQAQLFDCLLQVRDGDSNGMPLLPQSLRSWCFEPTCRWLRVPACTRLLR
jgi:hypothetical protein